MTITRRGVIANTALAVTGTLAAPAIAQADTRPTITVAVQKIANSNTLEIGHEASNVGTRHYLSYKEPLIDTDWTGDLSFRPGLATAWRRIDGRTVELDLRENVRFHNGRPFTAEDVVFSFGQERLFGLPARQDAQPAHPMALPRSLPAGARNAFPGFERIEIVSPHRVRFVNRIPDVTLEGRLSLRVGTIIERSAFEEAGTWTAAVRRPVGTGPYQVVEFRPDTRLVLEAFDGYWGGRPPIRRITFVEVPEVASRINGLLSGQFDFACDIPPDQIVGIERNPRYEVAGGVIMNHRILAFDKNHPQLADARVRRALTHAIDRRAIVQSLWAGRTEVPPGLQFDFFGRMLVEDWAVPAFDLAECRRLLREAGYRGDPIPYRVINNYYTNQNQTSQILIEMWRAAGLNVQLQWVENWSQILATNQPRAIRDWSATSFFNDPVSFIPGNFGPRGSMAQAGEWTNDDAFAAIQTMTDSTDWDERRRAWRRTLQIVEREDPAITLLHQTANFTGKRRDIRWRPARSFVMDFQARNFAVGAG